MPPGEGNGNPLQYFCLEKSHGQSSLSGYSPWGLKELDMIEHEYMPSALPVLAHSVFIVILWGRYYYDLILQMRRLREWEIKKLAQTHTASKEQIYSSH